MARWEEVVTTESHFAARVREILDLRKHKTLATLRRDGSPRISGIEVEFSEGEMWLGMMPGSVKARDVLRDPRVALHALSDDPSEDDPSAWMGDAKLAGTVHEVPGDNPEGGHRFKIAVTEVVLTRVGDPPDHLSIESWHEGRGLTRRKRY